MAARERLFVAALLLAMAAQLAWGLYSDGLAGDEVMYIAAGHRHLLARDFAINTEQPPLAKLAIAAPLAALRLREPPRTGDPWQWAFRFVVHENDPARVIAWARLPVVMFTLALAIVIWRWARALGGPAAGVIALALTAFHPSLLAHGHLATTDAPGALAMTLASWTYWRWSQRSDGRRTVAAAAAVALAVATRLTAWVLLPALVLLETAALLQQPRETRVARARAFALLVSCGVVFVFAAIWAAYGFRYAPYPGESVAYPPAAELGIPGRLIALGLEWKLLPEAYLEGARYVAQHNVAGHPTYLLGKTEAVVGPWYYYAVAFALKNTPGFLAAFAFAATRRGPARVAAVWLPALLTFAAASAGRIQIGERYVLAVYPYLIVLAAGALAPLLEGARRRLALVLMLAAHVAPVLAQTPRGYIPYFNLAAGGTDGGHRFLADSNLDWGQDLPRLAAWMRRHQVEAVQLAYHGPDDPDRFGIRHADLPGVHHYPPREPDGPPPQVVVVSPNLLVGLFAGLGDDFYAELRHRPPDDRAGVFFVYRIGR